MKKLFYSNSFKKDSKLAKKRGKDLGKLAVVIDCLIRDEPLPARCKPHKLRGEYGNKWECHIEPDWLLIYDPTDSLIRLERLGTHSDLFD